MLPINKTLKSKIPIYFPIIIRLLYLLPMEMGATEGFMKAQIEQLKEENRKLKKDLEFVYGWKDQLEKENENLKEELFKIKRNTKYNWLKNTLVYDDSKTAIEQGARAYEAELHNRYVSELEEENKKLKETIKDHQLYEEKLEHRIIEFEELLHGE